MQPLKSNPCYYLTPIALGFHSRLSHLNCWGIYYVDEVSGYSQACFLGLFCNMNTACKDFLLFPMGEWFNQLAVHMSLAIVCKVTLSCCWFGKFAAVRVRISCVLFNVNEAVSDKVPCSYFSFLPLKTRRKAELFLPAPAIPQNSKPAFDLFYFIFFFLSLMHKIRSWNPSVDYLANFFELAWRISHSFDAASVFKHHWF